MVQKYKKATINPINQKDNNCFQYTVTVALIYVKIGEHPERITKVKAFINKCNWEGINCSSKKMIGKNLRKII